MTKKIDSKAYYYAISAVFLWSTVATAFKLTLHYLTYAQLVFYASVFSLALILTATLISKRSEFIQSFKLRYARNNLVLGALNPFLYYLVLFEAYSRLPAQEAQPLNYTWPIALSLFAIIFLKEKFSPKSFVGLVLAFIGVFVIATRGDVLSFRIHNLTGAALAVGSSLIWASYWIFNLLDSRAPEIKLFHSFYNGTIFSAAYLYFFGDFSIANPFALLGAAYIGFFEMGATFILWLKALSLGNSSAKLSSLAYLAPFISLIFIHFVLDEDIFGSSVIGLILIISGILIQRIGKLFRASIE